MKRVMTYLLMGVLSLQAQSFEEFKNAEMQAFEAYKDARDRAFKKSFEKEFEAYKESQGLSSYTKPKPKVIPTAKTITPKRLSKENVYLKPIKKEVLKQPKASKGVERVSLFNTPFAFAAYPFSGTLKALNQDAIEHYFDRLAKSDYEPIVEDMRLHVKAYRLNDWALYLLIKKYAEHKLHDANSATVLRWFLMVKLGFDTKIALTSDKVLLLTHTKDTVYSTPSYRLDAKKYYALDHYNARSLGGVKTYKGSYPKADVAFDFSLKRLPLFSDKQGSKRIRFQTETIDVAFNQNLIDFYATYPQADYGAYFNAPMQHSTLSALAQSLKPQLKALDTVGAINLLLAFVQKSFVYARDQKQFGREKVMFADETLYYSASDCEDRAALFFALVKELLGLDIVGVRYYNHMATAIKSSLKGDFVMRDNTRYVVADPTYVNASFGQSMPQYKNSLPKEFIYYQK